MKHQLDFEKPIIELQSKLNELKQHQEKHAMGVNFEAEISQIEVKLAETRRQIYTNLTAWQRVQMARHPLRPFTLDYIKHAFADFSELHGDRRYAEDRAIVGGFARLGEIRACHSSGHQGSVNTIASRPAARKYAPILPRLDQMACRSRVRRVSASR